MCVPVTAEKDGSYLVPVAVRELILDENGSTKVVLEEGLWMICSDEGGSSASVLVTVSADNSVNNAEVSL